MQRSSGSGALNVSQFDLDQAGANGRASTSARPSLRDVEVRTVSPKREAIQASFAAAYEAQLPWGQTNVRGRAALFSKFAAMVVEQRKALAESITSPMRTGYQETLTAELLPLADAARWVSRNAASILATRFLDRSGRPMWLGRLKSSVHRVPHGLVLILGTWNYPLYLTGVQMLHALVAGNAVAVKPAPGCEQATRLMAEMLLACGVPKELIVVLDSSIEAGKMAIDLGVDHIVMTGSSQSGRLVLTQAVGSLTSATMELSGCDAVYVLPGADLHRVCDLLRFGLRLNGGATCISPRRVFVPDKISEVFHRLFEQRLAEPEQSQWRTTIAASSYRKLWDGVTDAVKHGAKLFSGGPQVAITPTGTEPGWVSTGHVVLTDVRTDMKLYSQDIFAPLLMIVPVESWSDALKADSQCPYALAASIFGPYEDALRLVPFISAGTITINDLIVPTADPRLPFGGRGESGFGVTRGTEGLLAMTTIKVVSTRLGAWLPHTKLPEPGDEQLLDGLLQFLHGRGWSRRFGGLRQMIQAVLSQRNRSKSND
jgi:acyl-CoA reductase-like NAD-dependent aldehyde dehydrogenase